MYLENLYTTYLSIKLESSISRALTKLTAREQELLKRRRITRRNRNYTMIYIID